MMKHQEMQFIEVIDSEENDEDGRIEVRQDFMDRVEEDIQQSSDEDEE